MSLGNIDTKMLTVVLLRTAKAKGIILFYCLKIFMVWIFTVWIYSHVTCEVNNIKLKRQEEAEERTWEMESNRFRLKSLLCHQLAVSPWVTHFTSLSLSFSSVKWSFIHSLNKHLLSTYLSVKHCSGHWEPVMSIWISVLRELPFSGTGGQ